MAISVARLTISRDRAITFHCNFHMAQSSPEKLRDVCRAAGTGDIETVNAWLRTAPDVNAQDDKGRPLLLLLVCGTIMARHVDLARKLLALGADVNASNDNRITVLHIASCGRGEVTLCDPYR